MSNIDPPVSPEGARSIPSAELEYDSLQLEGWTPEFTVWIVRRGSRLPMVVDSIWMAKELAEKRARLLKDWHAEPYSHLKAPSEARAADAGAVSPQQSEKCEGCGEWVQPNNPDSKCVIAHPCLERGEREVAVSPDPSLRLSQIRERCKEWLAVGGFWNPDLMDGAKTRELICDLDAAVSDLIRREQALRNKLGEKKDGELCCGGCGGPHQFDTSVPSVVWNAVIRAQGLDEFLCTSCIIREFVKAGRSFTATLWRTELGFHGVPLEVHIGNQAANDAYAIQEENNALRWKLHEAEDRADALRAYVQHRNCKATWPMVEGHEYPCTCGLAELASR